MVRKEQFIFSSFILLTALSLSGCEIFYHRQYQLEESIVVTNAGEVPLCSVLEKVASQYSLEPRKSPGSMVICAYSHESNGFPLLLGARKHDGVILVDVWAWNRGKEHEALKESARSALEAVFDIEVVDDPHPM